MRKKLLVGCAVLAVLPVVGLGAAALLLEGRVVAWADEQLHQQIDATVAFEDADVSLLSSFPSVELRLQGLTVTGKGGFEGVELARIPELRVALDAMSLLGDAVRIQRLHLADPTFNVLIDEQGRANYDIAVGSEGESSAYHLELDSMTIDGLDLRYEDRAGGTLVDLRDLDHQSSGDVTDALAKLDTVTSIGALTVTSGGLTLLRDTRWTMDADLEYEQATGRITFGDNRLSVNDLAVALRGSVLPQGEDYEVDLAMSTLETSFKALLSLVPSAYTASFAEVDAAGTLALDGTIKGRYASEGDHLPAFDLALQVADGRFRYPDLPGSVEQIAVDLKLEHPEGAADRTVIDVRKFRMSVDGSPVEGSLKLTHPTTDPAIDSRVVGRLDLGALREAFPLEGTDYSGVLDMDLDVGGRMSDFQAQNVDAIRARGGFRMTGVRYASADLPQEMLIDALDLELSPKQAVLKDLRARFGRSDVGMNGTIDGLLPYLLADGTLVGVLELRSSVLDMEPFEAEDDSGAAEGEEAVLVAVPTNLDLTMRARMGKVYTNDLELDDVKGTVLVRDGAVRMDQLQMGLLGGRMTMSGTYIAPTDEAADVDLTLDVVRFDLARTVEAFPTLAKIVPLARGATAQFDSAFQMKTRLQRDGTPDLSILFSKGNVKTHGLGLTPAPLAKAGEQLKNANLQKMQLDGTQLFYELQDGKMDVKPFTAKLGGVPATLKGTAGVLDQTMDFDLDLKLPTKSLQGTSLLGSSAVGEQMDVRINLSGGWADPKVKVSAGAVDAAVAEVKEAVGAVVDDLVAKARAQGDKLVAEAEKQAALVRAEGKKGADKIRSEAKAQGKKLVADAKGPVAQAAAKETAKKLEKEADKKADKLEAESDSKATAMVDGAKKQRDQLIAEATAAAR